jgi:hypothetical protein
MMYIGTNFAKRLGVEKQADIQIFNNLGGGGVFFNKDESDVKSV